MPGKKKKKESFYLCFVLFASFFMQKYLLYLIKTIMKENTSDLSHSSIPINRGGK